MIFEVKKGRTCADALNSALETLKEKDSVIHGQGKLIELRGKEMASLKELDRNSGLQRDNLVKTHEVDKSLLKTKVRKRGRIIAGQSGLIAILFLVLIL